MSAKALTLLVLAALATGLAERGDGTADGATLFMLHTVTIPDPHGFDGDRDGVGCES